MNGGEAIELPNVGEMLLNEPVSKDIDCAASTPTRKKHQNSSRDDLPLKFAN